MEILFLLLFAKSGVAQLEWKAFGPGLDGDVTLPIRYFQVEAHFNGNRVNVAQLKDVEAKFVHSDNSDLRMKWEWGPTWDGSFLVRYRLTLRQMSPLKAGWKFRLFHNRAQVFEHVFAEARDEYCSCPEAIPDFKEKYKCPAQFPTLQKAFEPFKEIDLDRLLVDNEPQKFYSRSAMYYVIKDQKLYRRSLSTMDGFKGMAESILLSLLRKVKVPDVEFVFDLGDWPSKQEGDNPVPIFAWCASVNSPDIPLPTWDQIKHMMIGMGRARGDVTWILQESGRNPEWGKKYPRALFRGRDSNPGRLTASELSVKNPELINAGLTSTAKRTHDAAKWGPKADWVGMPQHGQYKYQLMIDGTVAPFRAPALFMLGSLVFKQDSEYYEWWYEYMKPDEHYIPVKKDLSDLIEKLEWAKANDEKARQIAENGAKEAQKHLFAETVFCYYLEALDTYSKRQNRPVKVRDEMILIEYDEDYSEKYGKDNQHKCNCPKPGRKKENAKEVETENSPLIIFASLGAIILAIGYAVKGATATPKKGRKKLLTKKRN